MGIRFRKTKKAGPFRFSLTKKGVGCSVGNKYIGYSHGASGRKSLRASIPGTGISYITPIGRKKKRKKANPVPQKKRNVKVTTEIIDHTKQQDTVTRQPTFEEQRATLFFSIRFVAALFCAFLGICFFPSFASVLWWIAAILVFPVKKFRSWISKVIPIKPVRIAAGAAAGLAAFALSVDNDTPDTYAEDISPDTEYTIAAEGISREMITETLEKITETLETTSETLDLLANTPEKETPPTPIETEPEPAKPETQAPAVVVIETDPPETLPPETQPQETEPPEAEPLITITHTDSSLSPELVKALDGVAAFWAPTGTKIHLDPFCWTLQEVVYAGTVEEANTVKDGGWCGSCSKHANKNTKSNANATQKVIANCYSYQDYLNQIPATAFD